MVKVLYDSQCFEMQKFGGISNYFAKIIDHLPEGTEGKVGVFSSENVYLSERGFKTTEKRLAFADGLMGKLSPAMQSRARQLMFSVDLRLNKYYTRWLLKQGDFDVFHPTYYDPYFLPLIGNKPFVLTVHDFISEIYPGLYPEDHLAIQGKKAVIPKASHIMAISEKTKEDLMRFFKVPEEKVTVVYHGADEYDYIPSPKRPVECKYILYVGVRHKYKMFYKWLESCVPVLKRHPELSLVCTGSPFADKEMELFRSYCIQDRIIHYRFNTEQEMYDLYHNAEAFVYPSEYEGFGLPILEAYKARCPLILSNSSCFPEIAGDAAVYIENSPEGFNFAEQFEKVYNQTPEEREQLLKRQDERMRLYSWRKTAEQTAEVYRKLVRKL